MGDGRAAVFGRAPVTHQPFGHLAAILGQLLSVRRGRGARGASLRGWYVAFHVEQPVDQ